MTLDEAKAAAPSANTPDPGVTLPQQTIALPDDFDFEAASAAGDTVPEILVCEVCGVQLDYSGKGRKPRFCADHKQTRTASGAAPRGRNTTWKGANDVERNLIAGLDMLLLPAIAMDADAPLRKDAIALDLYGPKIIHELVVLAATDVRLRNVLVRLSAPGKYGALLGATFALVLSVANNHLDLPQFLKGAISTLTSNPSGGES